MADDEQNGTVAKKRKISSLDVSSSSTARSVTPSQPPTRSTKFWFEDGNFLVQAGITQFRVHQSVLAAQCTFFREAFERYHKGQASYTHTPSALDPPLMILPSSVEDMELLLAFLYDGLRY